MILLAWKELSSLLANTIVPVQISSAGLNRVVTAIPTCTVFRDEDFDEKRQEDSLRKCLLDRDLFGQKVSEKRYMASIKTHLIDDPISLEPNIP